MYKKELDDSSAIEIDEKKKPHLRVLSYNIWNNSSYWQERLSTVIRIIKSNSPDVICLMDVNKLCWEELRDTLEKYYIVFQVFLEEGNQSGIVLFCNRDTMQIPENTQPYYYDYNCGTGRIIGVELIHKETGDKVHVLATALDNTPDNDYVRAEQYAVIQKVTKSLKHYILVGDFNIQSHREEIEKKLIASNMSDVWIDMGCPLKAKYTYNGRKNQWARNKKQLRSTRIYSHTSHYNIIGFNMVGLEDPETKFAPSCHYGIMATFEGKSAH